ncbi:MAG: hypothetical protein A2X49_15195 [Lentisphaerae bacterium GWF2_52_8]|nr:MAG: hypothetical protein A2X49_15195 [Lentisphaerae bacterium GWF2_52_8]
MENEIDINHYRDTGRIHFIGCGGAGMAPLMLILHEKGFVVSGSDLEESVNTKLLGARGAYVFIGHAAENFPMGDGAKILTIFSSAVKEENPEMLAARRAGSVCLRRGEALAFLAKTYRRVVAISGSHGKTSVTAMLAHVLKECGLEPGYMVGGKVCGWSASAAAGDGDIFVTEVDESDGTHALVDAHIAIVTNVEDDHCWSVGGVDALKRNFQTFAHRGEALLYVSAELPDQLFAGHPGKIALDPHAIASTDFLSTLNPAALSKWGAFQRMNGALAVLAAESLGVARAKAEEALFSYPGVERRMSLRYKGKTLAVMEDYAHHPTELAASIAALREGFPDYRLFVIFQPHRYARLTRYIEGFAAELKRADRVIVTPVFTAWVEQGGASPAELAAKIGDRAEFLDASWEDIARAAIENCKGRTLFAVIGAGDIDRMIPPLVSLAKKRGENFSLKK